MPDQGHGPVPSTVPLLYCVPQNKLTFGTNCFLRVSLGPCKHKQCKPAPPPFCPDRSAVSRLFSSTNPAAFPRLGVINTSDSRGDLNPWPTSVGGAFQALRSKCRLLTEMLGLEQWLLTCGLQPLWGQMNLSQRLPKIIGKHRFTL